MKKWLPYIAVAVLMFAISDPIYAQGGCVDSPESPTAILAIAGSAGAILMVARDRFRRK